MRRVTWTVLIVGLLLVVAYGVIVAFFYTSQRSILFPAPSGYEAPAAVGLQEVREVPLETADGERVMTWRTGRPGEHGGRPLVLFFHGNGDRLPSLADHIRHWQGRGLDVVLATYRGYPGSTGEPSEAALVDDSVAIFDDVVAEGVRPQDILVAGFSLGSAVATAVAAKRPSAGLFLQAPMSGIDEVASHHYPYLPVRPLMKDPFRSIDRIGQVDAPVFIVHGALDGLVPPRFGRRLFAAAPEPKDMLVLPAAGHVLGPADGWQAFESFLGDTVELPAADPDPAGAIAP